MRTLAFLTAAALWLAPLMAQAEPATKGKVKPKPVTEHKESACTGDYGTSLELEDTPKEAATRAQKEQKLVMVFHISGHFEDPKLT